LYSLLNSIRMIKSRRMRLAGHVAYRVLVETPERKISLGIHEAKKSIIFKWILKQQGRVCAVLIWFRVVTCHRLLSKVNEPSASINVGNFLTKGILTSQLVTLLDYWVIISTIYGIIQEQMIYVITVHNAPYSDFNELKQWSPVSKTEVAHSLTTLPSDLSWDVQHYELNVIHQCQQ